MGKTIDNIISTRNRPAQLDLLLRTTRRFFKNIGRIFVIYKADNNDFMQGYEKVFDRIYNLPIDYIAENDFRKTFLEAFAMVKSNHVLFNSDDNVFINYVDIDDDFNKSDDIAAFSLRLGKGITYCLPAQLSLTEPKYTEVGKYIMWDWTQSNPRGCWGYPHPYDSNIYRTLPMRELLYWGKFKNPCTLENHMNDNRPSAKLMIAYRTPRLTSISNNELGQGSKLTHGSQSVEMLNEKWLNGEQIKEVDFHMIKIKQCHNIMPYKFERRDK